jgi:hypothetical protein
VVLLGAVISFVPWIAVNVFSSDPPVALFAFVVLPFPASIAVAATRRNLFELDLVLNRALVASITGGVLVVVYSCLVAGTTLVVSGSGPLVALPAAGAVAVLFAPVRERTKHWVAERLFGLSAEPGVVFDRLGQRLSSSADPDSLLVAVVETVTDSLRLPYAAIELQLAGAPRIIEQRGQPTAVVEAVEMRPRFRRGERRVRCRGRTDDPTRRPHLGARRPPTLNTPGPFGVIADAPDVDTVGG